MGNAKARLWALRSVITDSTILFPLLFVIVIVDFVDCCTDHGKTEIQLGSPLFFAKEQLLIFASEKRKSEGAEGGVLTTLFSIKKTMELIGHRPIASLNGPEWYTEAKKVGQENLDTGFNGGYGPIKGTKNIRWKYNDESKYIKEWKWKHCASLLALVIPIFIAERC